MVHEVAPDLVTRIRHAAWPLFTARLEQQLRRLDAVRGDHEYSADRAVFAAIRTLHAQRRDAPVRTDLDLRDDRLGHERCAGALGLRHVRGGVVLRLDGTDGEAAAASPACLPRVVWTRVA